MHWQLTTYSSALYGGSGFAPQCGPPLRYASPRWSGPRVLNLLGISATDIRDDRGQLAGVDGLRHMHVVACGQRQHPVLRPPVRGQRHGGCLAAAPRIQRSHLTNQGVPVLAWHFDVRDEHIGAPLLHNRESFARRTTRPDYRARCSENRACKLDRVLIVVNDKHPKAVETDTVRDGLQNGRRRMHAWHRIFDNLRDGEGQLDDERRSFSFAAALGNHGAPVQFDEMLDEGETEPEASVHTAT